MVHPWAAVILFPWCLGSYTFGSLFTQVEDDSSMPWLLTKTLHWLRPLFGYLRLNGIIVIYGILLCITGWFWVLLVILHFGPQ